MATTPVQLGPDEFAAKIKAQHPVYAKLPNDELNKKVLAKYPQYWKSVDAGKFAAKGMYQPASTETPTTSTGQVASESTAGKVMSAGLSAASPALAIIGGIGGAALAGPPGAVAGAALGGGVGKAIEQVATKQPVAGATYDAAVGQGLLEASGIGLSKVVAKVGEKAIPRITRSVINYIGLKPADLPKWGRIAEEAESIAKTVLNEAGVQKTLPAQRDAIEAARLAHDAATEKLVAMPGGKVTDFHSVALDRAVKLLDDVEKEGVPQEQINAIDKNLEGITENLKEHMTPEELLTAKRDIAKQITTWNTETTNVRQRYLQGLYRDINDAIKKALPADAAKEFAHHNQIQTQLIVAREAAQEKLTAQITKPKPGLVTKGLRMAGGAMVGSASGAGIAAETGQNQEHGAIVGGLIGAGLGSYGRHVSSAEFPALDVKVQQAIAKAASKLSTAARAVPAVARVLQGITSRPQNQP